MFYWVAYWIAGVASGLRMRAAECERLADSLWDEANRWEDRGFQLWREAR